MGEVGGSDRGLLGQSLALDLELVNKLRVSLEDVERPDQRAAHVVWLECFFLVHLHIFLHFLSFVALVSGLVSLDD